ncbi:hypothetical protein BHE74_00017978 [Ensete ventricosum]|nr:hypothetical protein GW17_00024474 [Ensete ventricosum]RWW74097.1 hypothetical protein BHE74_00017978 [Ensete ventricosum]RZR97054.1 hypothetical protein BHM03_00026169 [Ensete ventricosum]
MLTALVFREFCGYVVGPLLLMINKALFLLWQWKGVLSNCLILVRMTRSSALQKLCSGDGTLHAWYINKPNEYSQSALCVSQVASWNSYIGAVTCLKWAPRRVMFAAASTALTFWIPKSNEEPSNGEATAGE